MYSSISGVRLLPYHDHYLSKFDSVPGQPDISVDKTIPDDLYLDEWERKINQGDLISGN